VPGGADKARASVIPADSRLVLGSVVSAAVASDGEPPSADLTTRPVNPKITRVANAVPAKNATQATARFDATHEDPSGGVAGCDGGLGATRELGVRELGGSGARWFPAVSDGKSDSSDGKSDSEPSRSEGETLSEAKRVSDMLVVRV
jgi:hypothetical protein